jgi:hypothetical protein
MQERCEILTRHIIPRVSKRLGTVQVLDENAVRFLAETSERCDVGMRGAEKDVEEILSLAQLHRIENNGDTNTITSVYSQTVLQNKRRKCESPPPLGMYL